MKVELQSECITAIVRADLMSVRKHLRTERSLSGISPH